jgi:hypothetical protein
MRLLTEFQCPFCQSAISPDDVNVSTDLALCRNCGKTSSFAEVAGVDGIPADVLEHPPKGIRTMRNSRGDRKIVYRRISPILLFLVPFTAVWSGGSLLGIYGSQFRKGEFDLAQSLFGLPFLFGSLVLFVAIAYLAFGRWEIVLQKGMGSVFAGVGSLGWRRRFEYDRSTRVSLRMTNVEVNDVRQQGICVRTGENEFVFGTLIKEEAKQYIVASIRQSIADDG